METRSSVTNVNFEEPVRYPSFIKILNTYNFLIFKVGSSWLRISSFLITLKYFKKMTNISVKKENFNCPKGDKISESVLVADLYLISGT